MQCYKAKKFVVHRDFEHLKISAMGDFRGIFKN